MKDDVIIQQRISVEFSPYDPSLGRVVYSLQ
jgi:hypothetical protein